MQIQNTGTIAGNLCNASPAADGAPPLLILDAEVELRSVEIARHVPLGEFILGNRKTALRADELMTAIRVPISAVEGQSASLKLGARRYLVISIAMVAARVVTADDGTIRKAAIAVGSCSAVAQRLPGWKPSWRAGIPRKSPRLLIGRTCPDWRRSTMCAVRRTIAWRPREN